MENQEERVPLPFSEFLVGHTFVFNGRRYCLTKFLGGGLTAVVFLGELADGEKGSSLAFKFARDEERFRKALSQEWHNLNTLAKAERQTGTHYFPRAPHPVAPVELPRERILPSQPSSLLVLVQEFVSARNVHDLLLDFPPGLRLPERLALEVGQQYAHMLTILHGAGIACADRKLADLYWNLDDTRPKTGNGPSLNSGKLMVIDWNVTAEATSGSDGTIALDLFRFGLLWHWMLLGVEPRYRQKGQLEEPLPKHAHWRQLSFGTREILARLLHPAKGERYHEAAALLHDLGNQVRLWDAEETQLEREINPVYRRYVDVPKDPPSFAAIKTAMAAVDVLRVRKDLPPSLEPVYRGLRRAVREFPLSRVKSAMSVAQWEEAEKELLTIRKEWNDPAVLLQLRRYSAVAANASRLKSSRSEVKPLLDQSDRLFNLDSPDIEPGSDAAIAEPVEIVAISIGADVLAEQFSKEMTYRLQLYEARSLRANSNYREALRVFSHVVTLRQWLVGRDREAVVWIDQLYGDPTTESLEVERVVVTSRSVEDAFGRALAGLLETPLLPENIDALVSAIRCEPDNLLLLRLYRLLLEEAQYREDSRFAIPSGELRAIKRITASWADLNCSDDSSAAGDGASTVLCEILGRLSPDVELRIQHRREEIESRLGNWLGLQVERNYYLSTYLNAL